MSKLKSIFPTDEITNRLPGSTVTALGVDDISNIVRLKPQTMHELGLTTWHAAVVSGKFQVDPRAIGKYVDEGDPNLLRRVARVLGEKVLYDLDFTFAEYPAVSMAEPFALSLVAHLYPNRLHVGDVKLLDPRKSREDENLDNHDQTHESLRLFGAYLDNLRAAAIAVGADKITLTAAYLKLKSTFEHHGFVVEDSDQARLAVKYGLGIPMEMRVA